MISGGVRGTSRDRLAMGFAAAGTLLFCAGVLWAAAIATSLSTDCPQIGRLVGRSGLDRGLSPWPPGATCEAGGGGTYVYDPHPWLRATIIAFLVCGALALLLAIAAAIRDLARTPVQSTIQSDR
jgi:hypothetical protein